MGIYIFLDTSHLEWLVYDYLQWRGEPWQILVWSLSVALVCVLTTMFCWRWLQPTHDPLATRERTRNPHLRNAPSGQHIWYQHDFVSQVGYCNVCTELILKGLRCEVCGYCSHQQCRRKAQNTTCKRPVQSKGPLEHAWMAGNLPLLSTCYVCLRSCGNGTGLVDLRCLWCNRTVHTDCQDSIEDRYCDLGRFRNLIVSPLNITLKKQGWQHLKSLQKVTNWSVNVPESTTPLLVLVNPRSGGNDGFTLLRFFYQWLNPIQVADLGMEAPDALLEAFRGVKNCRVLVCGGDGTAGWVMGVISKLGLDPAPHVAVLPLGTGNDLARALGWGSGYVNEDIQDILRDVEGAREAKLDRWKISIRDHQFFRLSRERTFTMNNYFSVGVDAEVTLTFHTKRERYPWLFLSRTVNKIWYAVYGGKKIIASDCRELHKYIEVELDGKRMDLPNLEAIVALNINSYSAGARPWQHEETGAVSKIIQQYLFGRRIVYDSENTQPLRLDDKRFEVIGIESSFHISQLVVGLSDPMQLGQGSTLKLRLKEVSMPVQIDGEPWLQSPCVITISHAEQANVLVKVP